MIDVLAFIPLWYQYSVIFLFGLIIGSFLNVYIYRYHTGKSLNGSSHCLSCGHKLAWFELLPVLSFIFLRGKCRQCHSAIPWRYFLVELGLALTFLLIYVVNGVNIFLPLSLFLVAVLMVVTVYDMYHMVIPNELVVVTSVCAVMYVGLIAYGQSWISILLWHSAAALGAFLFFGGLWFVSQGKWIGFGDAKLAAPLAFMVGTPLVFSFIVYSFWIGAIISLSVLAFPAVRFYLKVLSRMITFPHQPIVNYPRYLTMKSEVPFAPFMVAAFLVVYIFHIDILSLMASFI